MENIKEADWVGIRLMFLLVAYDPSMYLNPEVYRAKEYYTKKYMFSTDTWEKITVILAQDNGIRGTFSARGVELNRVLENSIIVTRSGDKDGNEKKL